MLLVINPILFLLSGFSLYLLVKFLSRSCCISILWDWWQLLEDKYHVFFYRFYTVPQFNQSMQLNHLYLKLYDYLNSLPPAAAVEHSDFANLFSPHNNSNLLLHHKQIIVDHFLGARICWIINDFSHKTAGSNSFVLKIKKTDNRRILRPYLQHIHAVSDEINHPKLFINVENATSTCSTQVQGRWMSVPFAHPATIDTIVMEPEVKNKVKSDLESYLKSKHYYNRLGRVWKRSYLLYGPSGTGKTTFIAAMAKFLNYDVYDVDLSRVSDDSELKKLLLQTTTKSLVVIEDLDRILVEIQTAKAISFSGLLNFMDGIISCCGEERVMVFTMSSKDRVDPRVLRPGRIDVHLHFPLCDFNSFKSMASSHLGLKDHKLFPQVEQVFHNGGSLSPSEIGEIMIANRSSPSRALKSVILALQNNADAKLASRIARKLTGSGSVRLVDEAGEFGLFCKESFPLVKEGRKLSGFFRRGSGRVSLDLDSAQGEKERDIPGHGI